RLATKRSSEILIAELARQQRQREDTEAEWSPQAALRPSMQRKHQQLTPSPKSEHIIESRQGAVVAQLRPIFYCRINLAIALIQERRRIVAIRLGMRQLARCRILAPDPST